MIVLSCNNISKAYIVDDILKDISFTIRQGEKIGLIGLNGSGKTTLFNILAGNISRDCGDIYIQKDFKIGYLKQHTQVESDETIYDECLKVLEPIIEMEKRLRSLEKEIADEGSKDDSEILDKLMNSYSNLLEKFNDVNGYGMESEIKGVLKGLGFEDEDIHNPISILSGGQKARVSLAKLLLEKPDILLLDEPTNHLDIDAISWLESYIREYKGSALIISHDRYFLDNTISKIFQLEHSHLKIYNTNYSRYMVQRKKDLEVLRRQYEDQQKELKRQEEIIQRFANYGDRRYVNQARSRQKMLDKMKIIDQPSNIKRAKIKFRPKVKSGRDVLRGEHLSKSFGDFKLLEDINFNVYRGEKVGLIGANGIGKTTLFKMILGEITWDQGDIHLGHNVHTGYFDQEQSDLNPSKTIMDEIWDDNPKLDHYQIRTILSRFLFIGDDIFQEIEQLSGGEKGRLALLKIMLSDANFLLMDEPTNHLDIDSKEVLEDAIRDYEGTLFVISHDRYFLNQVTDKTLELTGDGIIEYLGNYDYYLEKKNEIVLKEEEDVKTRTQIKLERRKKREKLEESREIKEKIRQLEDSIDKTEKNVENLDKLLCDPNLYEDHDKIMALSQEREDLQTTIDSLYSEWIILTEE